MGYEFGRVMFGEAARRLQEARGSRGSYARREASEFANDELGLQEAEFLQMRDSFYLASVTEDGWPYVQHRGGRPGFLKVLDAKTLAFADYAGNKQYITAGNLETNDRVELFAMDYPEQARLKVIGHARVVEAGLDAALEARVEVVGERSHTERVVVIEVVAFDWNCSQHIAQRWTREELAALSAHDRR